MSSFNDQVIAEFRANAGMVGGLFEGKHLLLLHTIGRRTGQERVIPLVYTTVGDSYVVAGSQGGAEKDPLWVANVEAMPKITIELGTGTLTAKPTVVREGAERERLYAALVEYWPDFLVYETRTARQFPVIRLDPPG
jgi:deazaflavin-dependent oxidoreductase (nitroreductase family)